MLLYKKATDIAINVGMSLKPFCEVIHIAGSVRRKAPEVKDIELICVPNTILVTTKDLFGNGSYERIISPNYIDAVKTIGKPLKGKPGGRYMQIDHRNNVKIDLFTPDPVDFYRQYVIRTGSVEYIHRVIAPAWLRLGWCGTDQGLRRISDCKMELTAQGKRKWHIVKPNGERPPAWESEELFYSWIGVKWIPPIDRN